MSDPSPGASRWSETVARHRSGQREQILAAALTLLRERGIAGLTMAAIADRAGITRPTLYHYFSDIDAVLAAWVGGQVERSVDALVARAAAVGDPHDRLVLLIEDQCATFAGQDHRLGAEHFESEAASPAVRAEVKAKMAPLRGLLARTLAEAGPTADPELVADMLIGALGALRRRLVAGELTAEEASAAALTVLHQGGIRARPDAEPSAA
ncbi:MAG TPA: helix-turn-helix domain-containing protein [Solirubrobacteraceae bacterium]|nr:helix-turn-helix domain-containing protein [Solirubrobacteraceae bacterium]